MSPIKLGVNIDHVATLRNARGELWPDPVQAALCAKKAGADSITAHLREDRRHIRDEDMRRLKTQVALPLNMELAMTAEMHHIALTLRPEYVCIVPEKREEVTTEGGLDVVRYANELASFIRPLQQAGIQVSLFIDPDNKQVQAAKALHVDALEIHTGIYSRSLGKVQRDALDHIRDTASFIHSSGISCHAGHGLTYSNVQAIAAIPEIEELNIGHFLISESVFTGIEEAVRQMRRLIDSARGHA